MKKIFFASVIVMIASCSNSNNGSPESDSTGTGASGATDSTINSMSPGTLNGTGVDTSGIRDTMTLNVGDSALIKAQMKRDSANTGKRP